MGHFPLLGKEKLEQNGAFMIDLDVQEMQPCVRYLGVVTVSPFRISVSPVSLALFNRRQ